MRILEEIDKKSSVTYEQLAAILKKARTTVYRNLKKMVDLDFLRRVGSDKNGYWELNREKIKWIRKAASH